MSDCCQHRIITVSTLNSIPSGNSPEQVYEMLMKNFLRAYNGNTRAPIGFYMHAAWFFGVPWHYDGYKMFIAEITDHSKYDDVWIVPVREGFKYLQNPMRNSDLIDNQYPPFNCEPGNFPASNCPSPKNCRYANVTTEDFFLTEINMKICGTCPDQYPWLGNPLGESRS